MKRALVFILILSIGSALWAQNRYALVIGNKNYEGIPSLNNPINDANDMETVLLGLGFNVENVEKVLDGNLDQMEAAIIRLKNRLLSGSRNSYGFFFFAGHGVQSGGVNYLIPVDARAILSESHLRQRAVSLQTLLENLGEAENELNMVVLDACRDNPFSWGRNRSSSLNRGLYEVTHAPNNSIVMTAAGPGEKADDGTGRNGLFTGYLLSNLRTPGLSVFEVFDRTMGSVKNATGGTQNPALTLQYSGANSVYLGSRPSPNPDLVPEGLESEIVDGRSRRITRYRGYAATLNIPAQIQGLPVTAIMFIGMHLDDYCSLTSITIPSSVTSIGEYAFSYCGNLTSFTVDNRNPAYASIDGVLFDKNIRTLIKFPEGRNQRTYIIPSSVTIIGNGAFGSCESLTSITIPSSVSSIGNEAFSYCRSLTNVTIPSLVTSIGYSPFFNCSSLTSVTVDNRNSAYASIDGVLFDKNIRTIISYPAGKTASTYIISSSVTEIGAEAFACCNSLTSITIPSSVTRIRERAFYGCSSLTNVTLSRRTQVGEEAFPETARITYRD